MKIDDLTNDEILKIKNEINEIKDKKITRQRLSSSIKQDEIELEKLKTKLKDYEESYNYYLSLFNHEKQKIENLQKKLSDNLEEFQKLSDASESNNIKLTSLEGKLRDLFTHELLNRIYDVSIYNSIIRYIDDTTRTTPIMDDFYKSDKDYLLLRCSAWGYDFVYFVITKNIPFVKTYISRPTMTELKKNEGTRLSDLRQCKNAAVKIAKESNKKRIPFDMPCPLRGQTFDNQTGYGWEWEWGNLIREGTLYGETTDFLVIGIIYDEGLRVGS